MSLLIYFFFKALISITTDLCHVLLGSSQISSTFVKALRVWQTNMFLIQLILKGHVPFRHFPKRFSHIGIAYGLQIVLKLGQISLVGFQLLLYFSHSRQIRYTMGDSQSNKSQKSALALVVTHIPVLTPSARLGEFRWFWQIELPGFKAYTKDCHVPERNIVVVIAVLVVTTGFDQ